MWGSWVGLVIGALVVFLSFVHMYYGENPLQFMYLLNPIYSLYNTLLDSLSLERAIGAAIPGILVVFLSTPLVFSIYGWGIHSLFRKFSK